VVAEALKLLGPHAELLASSGIVFTINRDGQSLRTMPLPTSWKRRLSPAASVPVAVLELTESAAMATRAMPRR
jgi:hypothetical protein